MKRWRGVIEEFREFLPFSNDSPVITLNEGGTPLVEARNIPELLDFPGKMFFKLEGKNPTGSFKDRGMTVAISKALEQGAKAVICASTGNTAASCAAYAARAGIKAIVVLPRGKAAKGKLAQALLYGAQVIEIEGNFDDALRVVQELSEKYSISPVNSVNSYRLEGQKTAAMEIVDQLRGFPDYHFIPVGNAGNITAYWMGYKEYLQYLLQGVDASPVIQEILPKMMGWQAEGAAPIVRGHIVEQPETVASAIRIGNPARWSDALRTAKQSGGRIDMVSDQEILTAYKMLAREEGIFCEPASAASLAGFIKALRTSILDLEGLTRKQRDFTLLPICTKPTVVFTLTGDGLKDPDTAFATADRPKRLKPDTNRITQQLGLQPTPKGGLFLKSEGAQGYT